MTDQHTPLPDSVIADAELAELEYRCRARAEEADGHLEPPFLSAKLALRLVAEVRRLRSDDWLRAAAEEIADKYESGTVSRLASAVLIMRKHRDADAEPKP